MCLVVKNPHANAGDIGFNTGPGRFHAVGHQACEVATVELLDQPLKPMCPRARAPAIKEATAVGAHTPQLVREPPLTAPREPQEAAAQTQCGQK